MQLALGCMPVLALALGGFAPAPKPIAPTKTAAESPPRTASKSAPKAVGKATPNKAAWTAANIAAFDRVLADRARHGLDRVEFLPAPADGTAPVDDAARTKAALDYAGALAQGRVDPASLHQVYTLPRPKVDLATGLSRALAKGDLVAWFDGLPPQDAEYKQLSDAYLAFSAKASTATPVQAIPSGVIRVGNRNARVATIVEQLAESGYLPRRPTRSP
ncbi:hypothetical protein QP150_17700 [Sphingomonas sp. 22L2VL55-3]